MPIQRLVASPDGAWLCAVAHDRLVLWSVGGAAARVRELELGAGDHEADFVGSPPQLLVIGRDGSRTRVAAFSVPELELAAGIELDGAARLTAVSGAQAVLRSESEGLVVQCLHRAIDVWPVELRVPLETAVGLEPPRALLVTAQDASVWDLVARRPMLRLHLALAATRQVGTAHDHRLLWAVGAGGELQVLRLSDGRKVQVGFPELIAAAAGHPQSRWLLVATDDLAGGVRRHWKVNLAVGGREALAVPNAAAFALVVRGGETLAAFASPDGGVRLMPLQEAAPAPAPTPRPSPAPVAEDPARTPPPGATSLADRLRQLRQRSPAAAPEAMPGQVPPAPEPTDAEPAPERIVPLAPERTAAPAPEAPLAPAISVLRVPRWMAADDAEGWRESLAAWSQEVLTGGDPGEAPRWEGTTLAARSGLGPAATRGIALLYGAWLAGEGLTGVSARALARAIGAGGWTEALGRGELATHGLVRAGHGRIALHTAVGRYLDGAPPRRIALVGERPAEPGRWLVAAPAAAAAARLGKLAVVHEHRALPTARLEAWLHGALLTVEADRIDDLVGAAMATGDPLVIAWQGGDVPDALRGLTPAPGL